MVPTNNLAALGTFTAGEFMNLSATDRTGEGNDTDRWDSHCLTQFLILSPINLLKKPLPVQFFEPTGVDQVVDFDGGGFGVLLGDVLDDDAGAFQGGIGLAVELFERLQVEILRGF